MERHGEYAQIIDHNHHSCGRHTPADCTICTKREPDTLLTDIVVQGEGLAIYTRPVQCTEGPDIALSVECSDNIAEYDGVTIDVATGQRAE
jgi:hypothetical protein